MTSQFCFVLFFLLAKFFSPTTSLSYNFSVGPFGAATFMSPIQLIEPVDYTIMVLHGEIDRVFASFCEEAVDHENFGIMIKNQTESAHFILSTAEIDRIYRSTFCPSKSSSIRKIKHDDLTNSYFLLTTVIGAETGADGYIRIKQVNEDTTTSSNYPTNPMTTTSPSDQPRFCNPTSNPATGKCFVLFYATFQNWYVAQHQCVQTFPNGSLASLHSAFDQAVLGSWLSIPEISSNLWLGGTRLTPSGRFQWADGSAIDYSHWMPGGLAVGQGDCIQICRNNDVGCSTGFWRAADCFAQAQFVCEYDESSA